MRTSAIGARVDIDGARRLGVALAVSVGLHALTLLAVEAGPPATPRFPRALEAQLQAPVQPQAGAALSAAGLAVERWSGESLASFPRPALASAEPAQRLPAAPVAHSSETQPRAPGDPPVAAEAPEPAPAVAKSAAIQVPLPADTAWHAIAALDRPPVPLMPPDACLPQGASGEVVYELLIDETGAVRRASVISAEPADLFTAAAERLCAAIRFSPALKAGRAVRSRVHLVVGSG